MLLKIISEQLLYDVLRSTLLSFVEKIDGGLCRFEFFTHRDNCRQKKFLHPRRERCRKIKHTMRKLDTKITQFLKQ